VALVTMLETGRVELTHDLGLGATDGSVGFVLAALHVDFRAQGFFRDALTLGTGVARIGRTSFTLRQRLWRPADDVTIAEAESVLVVIGPDGVTPAPIPTDWRELLSSHQVDEPEATPGRE
jgi:acyl-CoA thioester hydrolase